VTFLALGLFTVAFGGRAGAQELDLRESLERAAERHPDLGEQRAKIRGAEANLSKARAGRLPRGELTSVFGIVNGAKVGTPPDGLPSELAPLFSEDSANEVLNDLNFFMRHELRINQPIWTFGKITHGIEAAKRGIEAQSWELQRQVVDVQLELKRVYYGTKLTAEILKIVQEVADAFEEAEDKASARLEEAQPGVSQSDVLRLRVARAQTQRRLLEIERRQQEALLGFRRAVGASLSSTVTPDAGRLRPVKVVPFDSVEAFADVVSELPGYRAALIGLEARQEAVAVARAKLYPDFFVTVIVQGGFAAGRDNVNNPFLFDPFNIVRGGPVLGLNWKLDVFTKLAELEAAQAEVEVQEAKLHRAATGLPVAIHRAYLMYEEKRQALKVARRERKSGRALSFLAVSNFSLGIGDPKEILESLGTYARAATTWYRTVHDFNLAVAELSSVVGQELDRDLQ
jgi:outer membrane protein TolC